MTTIPATTSEIKRERLKRTYYVSNGDETIGPIDLIELEEVLTDLVLSNTSITFRSNLPLVEGQQWIVIV